MPPGARSARDALDAVVVGSGPNGLAAAVVLARAGLRVEVLEGADRVGGGLRTAPLVRDDVRHDLCSAAHPLAMASRFFTEWGLADRVDLLDPAVPFAHALDGGRFAVAHRSLAATLDRLAETSPAGAAAYRDLLGPFVEHAGALAAIATSRLRGLPAGRDAVVTAARLSRHLLGGPRRAWPGAAGAEASALVAGNMAHAVRPLDGWAPAVVGLLLTSLAHAGGWPVPRGGSGAIAEALVADVVAYGGRVRTGCWVRRWADLPPSRAVLLDLDPRQVVDLAGDRMAGAAGRWYRAWARRYRFGPGSCTVHYVTSAPVPWLDPQARRAGTVHVGGAASEVAAAEVAVAAGRHARRPFTLVGQPTAVDPSRAPAGVHVVWAYCHVPHGSAVDAAPAVTAQIERFAPGFRDTVLARHVRTAADLARENPLHVGGDIAVGAASVLGIATRPVPRWDAYRTPAPGVYVCSSATPPGPGVHGMSGYWAAREVLRDLGARPGPLSGTARRPTTGPAGRAPRRPAG